ncbi:Structural maintenance of chromosomes protein 1 [Rhizina undulata]
MDAISFVLGIKSSHLRSAHLRDLIYRGRVLRTSTVGVGASKNGNGAGPAKEGGDTEMAEQEEEDEEGEEEGVAQGSDPKSAWVMAVYEDDNGEEQQWKRTITSAGASEYRINGKQVTAAQYNAALEAENILIKARNFLVFQGDVEAIASQSPKDLTRLIEQISGSLEYKAEYERLKIEQEKAAETSNFNLNRRRGINAEIKQYQEQKREAENYQLKQDERQEAIVQHILWKLFHFQKAIEQNKHEMEKHQEELKEFRRSHEKYANRLDEAKTEQAKAARAVSKQERSIKKKEKELEEKETSLVPVDEKISISSKNLKKYSTRIKEIQRDQESQSNTVETLKKELNVVEKAQSKFEREQQQLAQATGAVLSEADLAEYNKLRERVNTKIASEQIKIDNLNRQQKTDVEAVNSLKNKVESTEWQLAKLEGEVSDLQERREQMRVVVEQIVQEIDAKKKEYNAMTSERLRNAQKHTELEEKLHDCLNKLLEADDGRRHSEREIRMKETIAALKRIFPGVKGRVSELCKPKMKKYGDAVSTVLGRHFDAVVVDNEKTAKDCIEYLRDQRAGQATFLPLDTIQVKPLNSNLKGMHRGMRMAIDTIEFDSLVERAMQYACGNAVVCDDLDIARYICYEKGVEVKAVALDGTVIHKGGLMTGGRVNGPGGRRWEDQEVEALRRMKDNLIAQINALPKNRRGAQEETLQGELTGLEQRLAYSRDELKVLERTLESKKREVQHIQRQLKELQPKLNEATTSLDALKSKLEELQSVVSEAEDDIFAEFCERLGYDDIRTYEKRQGSLQQEAAQKKLEFTTQISRLQNQLAFETQRLKQTEERIENLQKLAERDKGLVEELEEEKSQIQELIDTVMAELDVKKEDLEQRKVELEKRAERVNELRRDVGKRSKDLENAVKTINGLEAEIERNAAGRYALFRRCKLEEIRLPLTADSASLDDLPIDVQRADQDAMDMDEEEENLLQTGATPKLELQDYGIEVDFTDLDEDLKESGDEKVEEELLEKTKTLAAELDRMAPNMKAIERLEGVENRLQDTERDFENSRKEAKKAKDKFQAIKDKRFELFNKAFTHISEQIGGVYKDLTKSNTFPLGGTAYLDMEDTDEPYLDGIKYHAMPPMKRFRDMEHLSGGEKTMAALALLFAVHSYQPSPFFVLDEVDAALDNANVQKISNYIRKHAGPGFQFIVISLKIGLFQNSETLVGIYRDQVECSSKSLTLDLRKYVDVQT